MKHPTLLEKSFAHRGLHSKNICENSISAFKAALDKGLAFELDILLSKDNQPMVFHDLELERLTGHTGTINDFTAEELGKIRLLGKNEDYIPHLKSVFDLVKGRCPILIEIKGDQSKYTEIAQITYEEIKKYDGPVAIMSFYPEIIAWFTKNAPKILRGLVATPLNDDEFEPELFSPKYQIQMMQDLKADFAAYDIKCLPNDFSGYCNAQQLPLLTWTVKTKKHRETASLYTDNIIFEIT